MSVKRDSNMSQRKYIREDINGSFLNEVTFDYATRLTKIKQLDIFRLKEYYMNMLLWINADFDDDLLLDVMNSIDCV